MANKECKNCNSIIESAESLSVFYSEININAREYTVMGSLPSVPRVRPCRVVHLQWSEKFHYSLINVSIVSFAYQLAFFRHVGRRLAPGPFLRPRITCFRLVASSVILRSAILNELWRAFSLAAAHSARHHGLKCLRIYCRAEP